MVTGERVEIAVPNDWPESMHQRERFRAGAAVAANGIAFGVATAVARRGVPGWDALVFRALNRLPARLAPVVWPPMQAGALGAPLTVAGFLAVRGRHSQALRIATTGAAAWIAAKAVKRRVVRGRPQAHGEDTTLRLGSADHGLGYPSGHAAVAVTLVDGLLGGLGADARTGGAVLALVVGVARVYVGAHFPLDVIGGWALGAMVSGVGKTILPLGTRGTTTA